MHFSLADNRSLPSLIDGLKPSQRAPHPALSRPRPPSSPPTSLTGLHLPPAHVASGAACVLEKRSPAELKVQGLASYTIETLDYKHGEASLIETIVKMAQDFVGANNVPLHPCIPPHPYPCRTYFPLPLALATLLPVPPPCRRPVGTARRAVPTRLRRVTSSRFSPVAKLLFARGHAGAPAQSSDDGALIEPSHFVPVLPVPLLNGSSGIGTGWMTLVHAPPDRGAGQRGCSPRGPRHGAAPAVVSGLQGDGRARRGRPRRRAAAGGVARRGRGGRDGVVVRELPLGMWTDDSRSARHAAGAGPLLRSLSPLLTHTARTPAFAAATAVIRLIAPCLRPRQGKAS